MRQIPPALFEPVLEDVLNRALSNHNKVAPFFAISSAMLDAPVSNCTQKFDNIMPGLYFNGDILETPGVAVMGSDIVGA